MKIIMIYKKLSVGNKIALWSLLCSIIGLIIYLFPNSSGENTQIIKEINSPKNVGSNSTYQNMQNSPNSIQVAGNLTVNSKIERKVPEEKVHAMKIILGSFKGSIIKISVIPGDSESRRLAGQIKNIFISSGWNVDGIAVVMNANYQGVSMRVKGKDSYPPFAVKVREALQVAGLDVMVLTDKRLNDKDVEICIGN